MVTFIVAVIALIVGYLVYGTFVERVFGIQVAGETPAKAKADGVDFVEMDWKRATLIQFLNIAGTGPIFGAIMGALWGPVAYLWIVFGCIFAGAVHDYLCGMLSLRHAGVSVPEVVGTYLGTKMRYLMRVFSVVLLILVGTVFITSPAKILGNMFSAVPSWVWLTVIIGYYMVATILPIGQVIGRFYPIFGGALLLMAVGIVGSMLVQGYFPQMPELVLENVHPAGKAIFPMLFVSIACGAISGFHATQAPMMARCLRNERDGRRVFYGAMILEGVVALIWASVAMTFFGGVEGLSQAGDAPLVVTSVSQGLLGPVGAILAILGVVVCPITSGDTAFRSARLTIADSLKLDQVSKRNRYLIAIPLFAIGIALCFVDFQIIWRYFAWSNQTIATIVLWTAAVYLLKQKKLHWIATIPATFMTAVVVSYLMVAPEGFRLPYQVGVWIGIAAAVVLFALFLAFAMRTRRDPAPQA